MRSSRFLFRNSTVSVSVMNIKASNVYEGKYNSGRTSSDMRNVGIGVFGALSALIFLNRNATECSASTSDETYKFQSILKDIDESYKNCKENNFIPGMVYGVMLNGRLIHAMGSGFADIEQGRQATVDTRFRIASMSKSFTAMAIIKLRDDGKLNLDDPAKKYIPALETIKKASADSPDITIRHLLTHTAGFPQDDPWVRHYLTDASHFFLVIVFNTIYFLL